MAVMLTDIVHFIIQALPHKTVHTCMWLQIYIIIVHICDAACQNQVLLTIQHLPQIYF